MLGWGISQMFNRLPKASRLHQAVLGKPQVLGRKSYSGSTSDIRIRVEKHQAITRPGNLLQKAIENGDRNSGFTQLEMVIFQFAIC
jgi:hypothetical protein